MSKREMMLQTASRLFIEKGYKNLTMDEIADQIGITKKTLYNHFPGKFELMSEAMTLHLNTILDELRVIADDKSSPFTLKLKKLILYAAHSFSREFPLSKLASESLMIQDIIFPAISKHIIEIIGGVMKEGVEKGILRKELKEETPPYILLGIIEIFMNMERKYGIKDTSFDLFFFIEKILLEGVLSDEGRDEYRALEVEDL